MLIWCGVIMDVVVYTCNPSTGEVEKSGSLMDHAQVQESWLTLQTPGKSYKHCLKKQCKEQLKKTPEADLWVLHIGFTLYTHIYTPVY